MKRDGVPVDCIAPSIEKKAHKDEVKMNYLTVVPINPVPNYYQGSGVYSSIANALCAIPTAGPNKPSFSCRYVVRVYPGTYNEMILNVPEWTIIEKMRNHVITAQAIGRIHRANSHRQIVSFDPLKNYEIA